MDSMKRGSLFNHQEDCSLKKDCSKEGDKIINDLRNRILVLLNKLLVAYRSFSSYPSLPTVKFTLSYFQIHLLHYQEDRQNSVQCVANYVHEVCSVNYEC
jgi:hypothetical protein